MNVSSIFTTVTFQRPSWEGEKDSDPRPRSIHLTQERTEKGANVEKGLFVRDTCGYVNVHQAIHSLQGQCLAVNSHFPV